MAKERARGGFGAWIADRARRIIGLVGLLVVVGVIFVYYRNTQRSHEPLVDLFGLLEVRGYRPNAGLSGVLQPGSIVQVSESGPDGGTVSLAEPVLFKWASDCFPTLKPQNVPYVLPDLAGKTTGSLDLGADFLEGKVPLLSLKDEVVASYHLELSNTQLRTLAKGDASRHFSKGCVDALAFAIAAGDRIDWYQFVVDAIVAESLEYEVVFRRVPGTVYLIA